MPTQQFATNRSTSQAMSARISEQAVSAPTFERAFSFEVPRGSEVKLAFENGTYSGDLTLRGSTTGRHLHGVMKTSRANLGNATTQYTVEFERAFRGTAVVTINGREHRLTAKTQLQGAQDEKLRNDLPDNNQLKKADEAQDIGSLRLPNAGSRKGKEVFDRGARQAERRETSPTISSEVEHVGSLVDGVDVHPIRKAEHPQAYQQLQAMKERGLEVKLTNYTQGSVNVATFQAFKKVDEQAGSVPVGQPITLTVSGSDYYDRRNEAFVRLAQSIPDGQAQEVKADGDPREAGRQESQAQAATIDREHHPRIRAIPGLQQQRINPQAQPKLAELIRTAHEGDLDVVLTSQSNSEITLHLWSDRFQRYADAKVSLPASVLEGQDIASTASIAKMSEEATRLSRASEWLVVDYEGTSQRFKEQVRETLDQIPEKVITRLVKNEYRVHAQKMMSQNEYTFSEPPRGWSTPDWPKEYQTTENLWNRVGGVHLPTSRDIIINEWKLKNPNQREMISESSIRGSVFHEVGHALSSVLGNDALAEGRIEKNSTLEREVKFHGICVTGEFKKAYFQDLAALAVPISTRNSSELSETAAATPELQKIKYFLTAGSNNQFGAGMSETFAQSFEVALRGSESQYHSRFTRNFHASLREMKKMLDTL